MPALMQRGLEERLGKRLDELDTAIRRSRADGRLGLESLRDMGSGLRRLDAKLDLLAANTPLAATTFGSTELSDGTVDSTSERQSASDGGGGAAGKQQPSLPAAGGRRGRKKPASDDPAGTAFAVDAGGLGGASSVRKAAEQGDMTRSLDGSSKSWLRKKSQSLRDLGLSQNSIRDIGLADSHASMAVDTRKVKHSFLVQFLQDEESEAAKAASGAVRRLRSQWARGLEAVFGICEPDPKQGKEGSRVIHPQSNFATGMGWWRIQTADR